MRTHFPYVLAALFVVVVQGLSLAEFLPVPVALLAGAAWAALIAFAARTVSRRPVVSARVENTLIGAGATTMALFGFGGAIGILLWNLALDSPSITGETMVRLFLPSIPIAIAANVPTELIIIPVLLILGWRPGRRRFFIVLAAALYFVLRIWTYLTFAPDRLDFDTAERSTTPLTAAERAQFEAGLHLDDPRWIVNLLIFFAFLLAAFTRPTTAALPAARQSEMS
ncbi:hypothetical protein OWR29_18455 [Actinoplanes sp. Pm04-4]|uniref:Uncharacterized protein n=1 Tax=Paractinoplanes pyxinae TaxID=2997416 RepID=A0ABT4B297_9ACTN|nr:hypothetical protein [Actinoplanes pyxinae]MCY1139990.1 hypothetical protein [Actinoplanes pyxinae]